MLSSLCSLSCPLSPRPSSRFCFSLCLLFGSVWLVACVSLSVLVFLGYWGIRLPEVTLCLSVLSICDVRPPYLYDRCKLGIGSAAHIMLLSRFRILDRSVCDRLSFRLLPCGFGVRGLFAPCLFLFLVFLSFFLFLYLYLSLSLSLSLFLSLFLSDSACSK